MFFKAINNSVGPNNLVLTLLVFGAYPHMTNIDIPLSSINQLSIAIYKAMEKVRRSHVSSQVNDVLNTRNSSSTSLIHDLSFNSPVLVFLEENVGQSR